MKAYLYIAMFTLAVTTGCSEGSNSSSDYLIVSYDLDPYINQSSNSLNFNVSGDHAEFFFRISGQGFNASVDFDEILPIVESVSLTYQQEGTYDLDLEIFRPGNIPFVEDQLTWEFSTEEPDNPIISFSERATADATVSLQVANVRTANLTEIWVEGDRPDEEASGLWESLPSTGLFTFATTPEDGLKSFRVKLSNIYGSESPYVDLQILKKSIAPTDCSAALISDTTSSLETYMQLNATDSESVFYTVSGDVSFFSDPVEFSNGQVVAIDLSGTSGEKQISVSIQDEAGNVCLTESFSVTVDPSYNSVEVDIDSVSEYWTDSTERTLSLNYDYFPSQAPIEMKISGDITNSDKNSWIPYSTQYTANLNPGSGRRVILVTYRDKDLVESAIVGSNIFLNPSITVVDAPDPYKTVTVDNIVGVEDLTIVGCNETYNDVAYQSSYTCEPTAAFITVRYDFDDGTSATSSSSIPP